ncbi:hypothetical protein PthBH41_08960 [Parageobacillus thermoglucosidasius]|nr:hypothetical protein PthBH41_08960 [Parageobacillus thermoglucosidasius]
MMSAAIFPLQLNPIGRISKIGMARIKAMITNITCFNVSPRFPTPLYKTIFLKFGSNLLYNKVKYFERRA